MPTPPAQMWGVHRLSYCYACCCACPQSSSASSSPSTFIPLSRSWFHAHWNSFIVGSRKFLLSCPLRRGCVISFEGRNTSVHCWKVQNTGVVFRILGTAENPEHISGVFLPQHKCACVGHLPLLSLCVRGWRSAGSDPCIGLRVYGIKPYFLSPVPVYYALCLSFPWPVP